MVKDLSECYKEIFEVYLKFCPWFRRNLINLKNLHDWLRDIDIKIGSDESDLYILMEWFNATKLIKPIAVLSYPPEESRNQYSKWEEKYLQGLISFPKEVYDSGKPPEAILWNYDQNYYLYHPIQFLQLLHYLRGNSYENLKNNKHYKEFYWKRRLNFSDYIVKQIDQHLEKENLSKEQYIKRQSEEGWGFNRFDFIYFGQNRWLSEKELILWIKLESLYQINFLRPSSTGEINIVLQTSIWDKKETGHSMFHEYNEWHNEVIDNFSDYFTIEDYLTLKESIDWLDLHTRFDGLNNFIDLFILINNQKKNKLKGYLSLFANMLQVIKVLRFFSNKLIKTFPELESKKIEPKWFEPKYLFENEEEKTKHIQRIYLDYGLTPKDTYILYVEGQTEVILLEDWLDLVYYRVNIKINIKKLPSGKTTAFMFEYLANNFDASEHFLILDADKPDYAEGKRNQLKGKGITGDSYHILCPDFVTANFEPSEIIEAFKGYLNDIKEIINVHREEKIALTETELEKLKETLEKKEEFEKFENIIEEFLSNKFNTSLKKIDFAQHLLSVMRNNFAQKNRVKKYPFEEIIGKFVSMIQRKQYPESLANKLFNK